MHFVTTCSKYIYILIFLKSREALHVWEVLQMLSGQVRPDCSQTKCTQGGSNSTKWTRFINSISSSVEECQGLQSQIQKTEKTEAPYVDPYSSTLAFFWLQQATVRVCLLFAYVWKKVRRLQPAKCSPNELQYKMLNEKKKY